VAVDEEELRLGFESDGWLVWYGVEEEELPEEYR